MKIKIRLPNRRRSDNEEKEEGVRNPPLPHLPPDIMVDIFSKLDLVDLLLHAQYVSSSWRRIARNPCIYQTISLPATVPDHVRVKLLRVAAKRGQEYAKPISLASCKRELATGLTKACKNLPSLEELEYTDTEIDFADIRTKFLCCSIVSPIGESCRQLKSLRVFGRVSPDMGQSSYYGDNLAAAIAGNMPNLRSLRLYLTNFTNTGLQAILAGCPHLEELDLQDCCFGRDIQGDLVKKCRQRIKDFTLPTGFVFPQPPLKFSTRHIQPVHYHTGSTIRIARYSTLLNNTV